MGLVRCAAGEGHVVPPRRRGSVRVAGQEQRRTGRGRELRCDAAE